MDIDPKIDASLAPTATTQERIRGLMAVGFSQALLASATKSSVSTVRNWAAGATQPRLEAGVILDDLRVTTRTLLGGLEPARVVQWFTSRDADRFDGVRPIEMIALDPMEVLAAAHGEVIAVTDPDATQGRRAGKGPVRPLALVGQSGRQNLTPF
jgi:hypothetical protein